MSAAVGDCRDCPAVSPHTDLSYQEWSQGVCSQNTLYEHIFGGNQPASTTYASSGTDGSEQVVPNDDFSSLWKSTISEAASVAVPHDRGFCSSRRNSPSASPEQVPMYLRDRQELTPLKLAEIRAKDAERKRRWRQKRRLEKQPHRSEDVASGDSVSEVSPRLSYRSECNHAPEVHGQPEVLSDEDFETPQASRRRRERRTSTRRADISPDRLKIMRAKDAERKRRARMRKRILSGARSGKTESAASTVVKRSLSRATSSARRSLLPLFDRMPSYDQQDCGSVTENSRTTSAESVRTPAPGSELSIDTAVTGEGPPTGASGVASLPSSHHYSAVSSSHSVSPSVPPVSPRFNGRSGAHRRLPRKCLPPDQLKEVREKDNARKREQRAKQKQEKQLEMASTLLKIMNNPSKGAQRRSFPHASAFGSTRSAPCPPAQSGTAPPLLLPALLSPSLPISASFSPLSLILPPISAAGTALPSCSKTPFNSTLSVDVSTPCVAESAPASLLGLRDGTGPGSSSTAMDLLKSIVEQARVHRQFSPKAAFEDRTASKRAARAARLARMSEEEKDALRASDRERKRLWRQRRRLNS